MAAGQQSWDTAQHDHKNGDNIDSSGGVTGPRSAAHAGHERWLVIDTGLTCPNPAPPSSPTPPRIGRLEFASGGHSETPLARAGFGSAGTCHTGRTVIEVAEIELRLFTGVSVNRHRSDSLRIASTIRASARWRRGRNASDALRHEPVRAVAPTIWLRDTPRRPNTAGQPTAPITNIPYPVKLGSTTGGGLSPPMSGQYSERHRADLELSVGYRRHQWLDHGPATNQRQLLHQHDPPGIEIDIAPPQTEELAPSHSRDE